MARNNLDGRFGDHCEDNEKKWDVGELRKKNRILELIVGLLIKDKEVFLKKELEHSKGNVLQENKFSISILQKLSANLLNNKEEKSLECLCGLLQSIGNKVKCEDDDLKNVLDEMEHIVKAIPRRADANPKTIDQIRSVGRNNRQTFNNRQAFTMQTERIRAAKLPDADAPLGSSQLFGSWGKEAGGSKNQQPVTTSQNIYMERRPMTRPTLHKPIEEQVQKRILNSLDEYLAGCCTTDEYYEEIFAFVCLSDYSKIVYECYNHVLERSQIVRLKTGELFAKLIKTEKLSIDSFIIGFEELLGLGKDLVTDMPQIWQYFAEDLAPLCLEEVLPVNKLHKLLDSLLISNNIGQKLLKPLFEIIVKEKGPNFLYNTWQNSGMHLSDFMSSSEVQLFVQENNFEFLIGGKVKWLAVGKAPLSYEEMQSKLSEFFKWKMPYDDIVNWISANIGEGVKENKFIRTLATAIFQDSISKNKLVPAVLISHTKLILKYVDYNTEYELQCLYALQSLAHKLEHPQGLFLSICDKLYEDSTFCQESFIVWESSTDPAEQEGKGLEMRPLNSDNGAGPAFFNCSKIMN